MNIKYVTYARYSTSIPIYSVNQDSSNKSIVVDGEKIASKIKALRAKVDQREKLRTGYGVWYVTHDNNDICYAVCTQEGYPERHAYGLIQKIKQKIEEINHCEYQTEENIKAFSKKTANELAVKYNDLTKIDKIAKANSQVKLLEKDLGDGIQKIVKNQQALSDMQQKAGRMQNHAKEFEQKADDLERMMYWRNIKIKVIIALCVIGLVGFIVMSIILKVKGN